MCFGSTKLKRSVQVAWELRRAVTGSAALFSDISIYLRIDGTHPALSRLCCCGARRAPIQAPINGRSRVRCTYTYYNARPRWCLYRAGVVRDVRTACARRAPDPRPCVPTLNSAAGPPLPPWQQGVTFAASLCPCVAPRLITPRC